MEASHKKHRPHIKVGKDAEEEEEFGGVLKTGNAQLLYNILNLRELVGLQMLPFGF